MGAVHLLRADRGEEQLLLCEAGRVSVFVAGGGGRGGRRGSSTMRRRQRRRGEHSSGGGAGEAARGVAPALPASHAPTQPTRPQRARPQEGRRVRPGVHLPRSMPPPPQGPGIREAGRPPSVEPAVGKLPVSMLTRRVAWHAARFSDPLHMLPVNLCRKQILESRGNVLRAPVHFSQCSIMKPPVSSEHECLPRP